MERNYTYHSYTRSFCNHCEVLADAKIVLEDGKVFLIKRCPEHGIQKSLLEDSAAYYLSRMAYDKPGTETPVQTAYQKGCPYDCGLCPEHDQHTCIALIEVTQSCNLNCPECYAHDGPDEQLTLTQIEAMMDFYMTVENGAAEILQISGGEPTLHPQIAEILTLAMSKGFRYVMLNTNGLRLLEDPALLALLAGFKGGFEVYLQFDGFDEAASDHMRGSGVLAKKRAILDCLKANDIPTTLVVTVDQKVNGRQLGQIVGYAMEAPMIRGVNFQPLAYYGATPAPEERSTLSGILMAIEAQTNGLIKQTDFISLPCNVERVAVNYMFKDKGVFVPLAQKVDIEGLVSEIPNTLSFKPEQLSESKAICSCMKGVPKLNKLLSKQMLKGTIDKRVQMISASTFRLTVTSFLDRYNFDVKSAQKECVHIITPDLKRMPFSTYNLIHRKRGMR